MGGDHGVKSTVPGALIALKEHQDISIVFVGQKNKIERALKQHKASKYTDRITIHHASEVVGMEESPALALRNKKDSSMRVAINLVKDGQVNACVSAGNTGALMATSRFVLKTLADIDRPAIVSPMPGLDKQTGKSVATYMLDLGANVNCTSEQLFQFAVMGSILASAISGNSRPRVGLLNIGEEDMKGLDSIKQASKMLYATDAINYVGFIEGNDIFSNRADVIVCDGFVGNVALKTTEGVASLISKIIKDEFSSGLISRLSLLCALPVLRKIKKRLDTRQYNGGSLLGLRGIVIKSHGGADAHAFAAAITEAYHEVRKDVPSKIQAEVGALLQQAQEDI
ncbi:phosphate acyltransferase PlsX [Thiotrichales bacterium 19S9-12]|nr:phosphate acyltransferase PlsX [Thiotrichales bacterium 19S9-11]MCF6811058.1 phosphate acyltransferase PlsX [Thiotrichales bacterium 19S9-12]